MKFTVACVVMAGSLAAGAAHAQSGVPWGHTPSIVVVSADRDPRLSLVDEAFPRNHRQRRAADLASQAAGAACRSDHGQRERAVD